jgi:hypothetical protein
VGAWDVGAFDNDEACDWAAGLRDGAGPGYLEDALDEALVAGAAYLDSSVTCRALAAADVVARWSGARGVENAYTEDVDAWVAQRPDVPPAALREKARAAVDRVLGPASELRELWEESASADAWRTEMAELRRRLTPPGG